MAGIPQNGCGFGNEESDDVGQLLRVVAVAVSLMRLFSSAQPEALDQVQPQAAFRPHGGAQQLIIEAAEGQPGQRPHL